MWCSVTALRGPLSSARLLTWPPSPCLASLARSKSASAAAEKKRNRRAFNFEPLPNKPVITVPVKMQHRALERKRKKRENRWRNPDIYEGDRSSPPLIDCRRKELNHYKVPIGRSFIILKLN